MVKNSEEPIDVDKSHLLIDSKKRKALSYNLKELNFPQLCDLGGGLQVPGRNGCGESCISGKGRARWQIVDIPIAQC
jgi:hypothetical protein